MRSLFLFGLLTTFLAWPALASEPARVPWTTSRLQGSPEAPPPFQLNRVFAPLQFKEPVDLTPVPGSRRVMVAELSGKLFSFFPNATEADLALDLRRDLKAQQLFGFTFHPRFASNHFVYVCYVTKDADPQGCRVSRFTLKQIDPPLLDPASEKVIIQWLAGGHNAGCLKFGPDGFLYIATGDTAAPNPPDPLNTGQDLSDLLSSILRVDVDQEENGRAYAVPIDNPFLHTPGARPEIWAYGFRNPWKMSFDAQTGALWAGDVGWELWEMIYRVEKGGNYGWSVQEGPQPIKPVSQVGPTPIQPPVIAHPHTESASITGGIVYRGKRLPDLQGAYIYGDWVTGRLWGLRHDGQKVTWKKQLAQSTLQIISFGEDADGELCVLDFKGGLYQLSPTQNSHDPLAFPQKLSQTGLFTDTLLPAPGVLSFSIQAELWSDGALAQRFVAIPGTSTVVLTNKENETRWAFPAGSVLAKTLSLESGPGLADSPRKVETQILQFDGVNWNAYSYAWNEAQTDASLVPAAGRTDLITLSGSNSGLHTQSWRFHSRSECLQCHNASAGPPLSFNALQLAQHDPAQTNGINPLQEFGRLGLLHPAIVQEKRPHLVNPHIAKADLASRARSYLHVNCGHCHREGAGGSVPTHLNFELSLQETKALNTPPFQGQFGLPDARIIAAGHPLRSTLLYRVSALGPAHMPRLGSAIIDQEGVQLIGQWILSLPEPAPTTDLSASRKTEEQIQSFIRQLGVVAEAQSITNAIDNLLSSPAGTLALLQELRQAPASSPLGGLVQERLSTLSNPLISALLEPLVPAGQRVKKLGLTVDTAALLTLRGEAERGKKLFFQEGGPQCFQCHRINGNGRDLGPSLAGLGKKYSRQQLLDNILFPSKTIDPPFVLYQVEIAGGEEWSGFLPEPNKSPLKGKDLAGVEHLFQAGEIKRIKKASLSAMPEGLLQNLTVQQAADLLEYLSTL